MSRPPAPHPNVGPGTSGLATPITSSGPPLPLSAGPSQYNDSFFPRDRDRADRDRERERIDRVERDRDRERERDPRDSKRIKTDTRIKSDRPGASPPASASSFPSLLALAAAPAPLSCEIAHEAAQPRNNPIPSTS